MKHHLAENLIAVGHPPVHCAWFRPFNSAALEIIVSLMEGAAVVASGTTGPGEAIGMMNEWLLPNDPHERHDLTHHVAVSVTDDTIEIWSGDKEYNLGKLLATYSRGEFRGHFHHYPERVDLTLDAAKNGRMVLTGSWTHLNDECLHTARAAAELASGPAH
jgi:hypothetical protein